MTSDLIEAVSLSAPLSEDWLALSVCLRKPEHEERRGREREERRKGKWEEVWVTGYAFLVLLVVRSTRSGCLSIDLCSPGTYSPSV